jgi:iron complex transport system substrate-binding protein
LKPLIASIALGLAGCASAQPTSVGGIVSTNPCSDQLLLALAPDRVTAISHYSHEQGATSIPLELARRYRATAGTAEEVIALRPDLVVASSFTPKTTLDAYRRAGLKVLTLDSPTTIAASRDQIRSVAAAVGAQAAGERLVTRIDRAVADAAPRDGRRPSTLLYISDSFANGGPSLLTEMVGLAGLGDASKDFGLAFSGNVPIESLVGHPPRIVIDPDPDGRTASLRRRVLGMAGYQVIEERFPRQLVNCGGPTIIPALRALAAIRSRALS